MKRELEDYEEGDSLPEEILATVVGEVTAPTSTAIVVGDSEAPSAAKSARIVTYPTNVSTYSVPVASAPSSLPFHCFNCKSILSTRKSYKAHLKVIEIGWAS